MVDIMAGSKGQRRRTHSEALKAEVVAACADPGASVAAVALAHGLNANLVHKWRRQSSRGPVRTTNVPLPPQPTAEFVALPLSAAEIRVEICRGASSVAVHWPISAAAECAAWLGAWLW
jgi:transposase